MRKDRKELGIGLLCMAVFLIADNLFEAPEFLKGLSLGVALCFEVVGLLPERAYRGLKAWKRSLLNKGS